MSMESMDYPIVIRLRIKCKKSRSKKIVLLLQDRLIFLNEEYPYTVNFQCPLNYLIITDKNKGGSKYELILTSTNNTFNQKILRHKHPKILEIFSQMLIATANKKDTISPKKTLKIFQEFDKKDKEFFVENVEEEDKEEKCNQIYSKYMLLANQKFDDIFCQKNMILSSNNKDLLSKMLFLSNDSFDYLNHNIDDIKVKSKENLIGLYSLIVVNLLILLISNIYYEMNINQIFIYILLAFIGIKIFFLQNTYLVKLKSIIPERIYNLFNSFCRIRKLNEDPFDESLLLKSQTYIDMNYLTVFTLIKSLKFDLFCREFLNSVENEGGGKIYSFKNGKKEFSLNKVMKTIIDKKEGIIIVNHIENEIIWAVEIESNSLGNSSKITLIHLIKHDDPQYFIQSCYKTLQNFCIYIKNEIFTLTLLNKKLEVIDKE